MSNVAPDRIAVTVKEAARLLGTNDKQIRRESTLGNCLWCGSETPTASVLMI